jgi:hypothetical protein
MKEPGELPPELESLVTAERNAPAGSAMDHRRIRARLGVGLGVLGVTAGNSAASGGPAAGGAAAASATAVGGSLVAKLVVVGFVLSAATGGAYMLGRKHGSESAHRPAPVAVEHSMHVDVDEQVREDREVVAAVETPRASVPPDAVAPATEGEASQPDIATRPVRRALAHTEPDAPRDNEPSPAEAALIVAAWRAVDHRELVAATSALDEHERQFPGGLLAEERDALRVRALLLGGEQQQAEEHARGFLARYPGSVHAAAVERALEGVE